eukprot:2514911-Pleurochrysis_carterae.AAC.3
MHTPPHPRAHAQPRALALSNVPSTRPHLNAQTRASTNARTRKCTLTRTYHRMPTETLSRTHTHMHVVWKQLMFLRGSTLARAQLADNTYAQVDLAYDCAHGRLPSAHEQS